MPDDKHKVGKPDRDRINLNEVHEFWYWCAGFGVTEQPQRNAVKKVGQWLPT